MTENTEYNASRLSNGVRIVTEAIPWMRTASVGIYVEAGARHETGADEGAAHFLEHLAFKGTTARTARDIAFELDRLGGNSNAFTGRELTCFHARVASGHVYEALDVLADMVLDPTLDAEEIEREKNVVLQEIAMSEDTPEECLLDSFWNAIWTDGRIGHPVLGSMENVNAFSRGSLLKWRGESYAPAKIMIAAAGKIDHGGLVEKVAGHFDGLKTVSSSMENGAAVYRPGCVAVKKDIEQNHFLISFPAVGSRDERRYVFALLNNILGGGMSSRLFQEIREKRGLAYSVYSMLNGLSDAGVMQIYAAVDPANTDETLKVIRGELEKIASGRLMEEELEHSRENVKNVLTLGLESTNERMARLAGNQLLFDRYVTLEETFQEVDRVDLSAVIAAAGEIFVPEKTGFGILGPRVETQNRMEACLKN